MPQYSEQFVVGEVRKNRYDTIRVSRLLVDNEPYASLQLIHGFIPKGADKPQPERPLLLKADRIDELIQALESVKAWHA